MYNNQADQWDKAVAIRLRQQRIVHGLSQREVAAAIGKTFQQWQKYENGKNRISVGNLLQVLDFLNVSVSDFLHFDIGILCQENETDVVRMCRYYRKLSPHVKQSVLNLCKGLASDDEQIVL